MQNIMLLFVTARSFRIISINQKTGDLGMNSYYLPDANFSVEDSEIYRSDLLAQIFILMQK